MKILLIAEHDQAALKSATLNTICAATKLGDEIDVLVAGHDCGEVAAALQTVEAVSRVLLADAKIYQHLLAENLARLIHPLVKNYDYLLAPATTFGKNLLPRVAALCDVAMIGDVISIESADTFVRPIYAGNALETVQASDALKIISVRTTAFDAAQSGKGSAEIVALQAGDNSEQVEFISHQLNISERPELSSARVIVSGGRGLGTKENFALIEALAEKLGAAVGASRAAVDAGFVPNDYQVGQTGKIVAPDLYIAIGISGAIQHLAGMKDSKVIVAINKDADAPIFQVADYGLVADLFEALPQLTDQF
jgi:electron transfer flavoprotein alpha subunit